MNIFYPHLRGNVKPKKPGNRGNGFLKESETGRTGVPPEFLPQRALADGNIDTAKGMNYNCYRTRFRDR